MVTKVTELRGATEFSSNFEYDPGNSSGLLFGVNAGAVKKIDGTLYEFAGGQANLPNNSTGTLYLDTSVVTPALGFESTITAGSYIPLYRITTSGGSVVSIEDVRSWTSASIGPNLVGAGGGGALVDTFTPFETLVNGYSPHVWYRFNTNFREDSVLYNHGSQGSAWDLTVTSALPTSDQYKIPLWEIKSGDNSPAKATIVGGRQPQFGSSYTGWDKISIPTTSLEWLTNDSTGSFIIVTAWGYDAGSQNSKICHFYNTSAGSFGVFLVGLTGDTFQAKWDSSISAAEDWEIRTTAGINQDAEFPIWKVIVISQPGDGGGPKLYVDGADLTNYQTMPVGSEDRWFSEWTSGTNWADTFVLGGEWASVSGITNSHEGAMDHFAYTSTALTQAQALALYNAYNGL